MNSTDASAILEFFHSIGRLKRLPRTGWLDRGVPEFQVESVADHSFRVALIAWLMAADEVGLDRDRVLKLALIHDLAEAITGDLTPYDPDNLDRVDGNRARFLNQRHIASSERTAAKRAAEDAAFTQLTNALGESLKVELRELWQELSEKTTPESRFVKEADRIETYLQSTEYVREIPELPIDSFRLEVEETLTSPPAIALRTALLIANENE